jgi:signal transduction histidine kinase
MFKKPLHKLTASYMVVIIIIAFTFSMVLYGVSTSALDRSARRPLPRGVQPGQQTREVEMWRDERFAEAKSSLRSQLIMLNLLLIGVSGVAAYMLAAKHIKPLEESLEKQRQFTASAAHDLKTPLSAMLVDIDLGLRKKSATTTDYRTVLKSSREEVLRLDGMISSMLNLANVDVDSKQVVELEREFDLSAVVAESMKMNKLLYDDSKQSLRLVSSLSTSLMVKGQADLARSVLDEVLANALKYGKSERGMEVEIHQLKSNVRVCVRDYGVGISEQDLPRVRDRFFRADKSRTRSGVSGSGLGLAIADEAMTKMNGSLSIKSELACGTTATLSFVKS